MKYIRQYAKLLKKQIALEEILKDLKPTVQKELRKCLDQKAIADNVEFHITSKAKKEYPAALTEQIKQLRADAEASGKVKTSYAESFDAYIPKSVKEEVLAKSSSDYRKHFNI